MLLLHHIDELIANLFVGTIKAFGNRTIHTYHTEGAGKFSLSLTLFRLHFPCRRWSRTGYYLRLRVRECPAVLDKPDSPVCQQHAGRAPGRKASSPSPFTYL